jgi:hypothetical protein
MKDGRSSRDNQAILTPEQQTKQRDSREAEVLAQTAVTLAMKNALRTAPAVIGRVGDGASYTMVRTSETMGQPSRGDGLFKVAGPNGSAWFTVKWERAQPGAPVTIIGIADASAEMPAR